MRINYRLVNLNDAFTRSKYKLKGLRKITVLYGDVKNDYQIPHQTIALCYREIFMLFIDD